MTSRPKIALMSCGGTIVSVDQPGLGAKPTLDVADIARQIPGVAEIADVSSIPVALVPSPHMNFGDLRDLARNAAAAIEDGCDGIVVTQGTDTIEEIAYGLDLMVAQDAPVVVTGAMRNASMPGAEGPANLLAAITTAASPEARGLGTLVVMNDEIHAARFVRKAHTANTATFRSPHTGPLGWIAERDVRILVRPAGRFHVSVPDDAAATPAVCLWKVGLGDDGRLLDTLRQAGYTGVVLEGFGGGHLTQEIAKPGRLEDLMSMMPVVLVSRAGNGEVLRGTYGGFAGSETDLIARGVIFGGALDGPKARVLLTLLLMRGASRTEIKNVFEAIGPRCGPPSPN